ncbi:hydrogenase [Photobacterium jeanii]|uniref:Hydrogenase n=1 Tax=Photobacterium jeanii TaxID=858640 RepID=A0A178K396_9GAMM|nr:cytochrome b/b6 domain-containing protein [Photobacterium jeanii]OAN11435.1 hydrogenase [Photobacterium jeanii]PST90955.1 hydrogenase [Photobacterium jeanii]
MKIWDLPARIYHWLQAILFCSLLASGNAGHESHVILGLMLFVLVTWRWIWGVVGSETSRFRQFLRSPFYLVRYLQGKTPSQAGHNPLGGWMVLTMLSALLIQCISGLALAGMLDNLPLTSYWLTDTVFEILSTLHLALARLLPLLVVLHLGAILFYKLRNKPLVLAMFTGKQSTLSVQDKLYFASNLRAMLVLITSGLITIAIIALA